MNGGILEHVFNHAASAAWCFHGIFTDVLENGNLETLKWAFLMKFPEAKTTENLLFQACSSNSGKRIYSGSQELYFPTVPKDILYNLSNVTKRSEVTSTLRYRVVEWLSFDLFHYTMYPGKLYEEAAR